MSGKSGAESARSPSDESIVSAESEKYVKDFKAMKEYMQKMEKHLIKTECVRSDFCEETGLELYLKKECCQITKSCHARSALCTLLSLTTEQKQCGVITALQEDVLPLCHFGNVLNIPVEIVLPNTTLSSKIAALRRYKATLTIEGNDLYEAETIASELAIEKNMYCIKRNDETRYFGYGTIGIEIIEQVPSVDVVVVPCYKPIYSSIITVVKVLKPSVVVIIASYKPLVSPSAEAFLTSPTSDSVSCQKLSPPNILKSSTVSSLDRSVSFSALNLLSSEPTLSTSIEITASEELSSETGSTSSSRIVSIQMDLSSGIESPTSSVQVRELIPSSPSISETSGIEGSAFQPPSIHGTLSFISELSSEARTIPSVASIQSSSSSIEKLSIEEIELPPSINLTSSSSFVELPSSISFASDEISLSTDSMSSCSGTSCALAQVASSSQQRKELDNDNVTRVILNKEEVDTAILKLSEKEQCTPDRFGVVSFAACLRACTAGSLFDAYKNKSVVALLANSADNQIDFVRLE